VYTLTAAGVTIGAGVRVGAGVGDGPRVPRGSGVGVQVGGRVCIIDVAVGSCADRVAAGPPHAANNIAARSQRFNRDMLKILHEGHEGH
jgi:hypothetical protein